MLTQLSKIIKEKCYESVKILCQNIFMELDLQDVDENLRKEIFTLIDNGLEEYVKLVTFGVSSIIRNKDLEKKCVSLEATVEQLKQKLSQKNAQDSVNKTLFNDDDGSSPRTSPNDLNANQNLSDFIHSLSSSDRAEENEAENILKTPSSQTSYRDTSPVVQKQSRSGKRNRLCLKSNKRYRTEDESKVDPNPLAELSEFFLDHALEPKKDLSPESKKDLKDCTTPLAEMNLSEDDNCLIEPSPAPVGRSGRINPLFGGKKLCSVENVNILSPISQNLLSNRETHQFKPPEKNDNRKEEKIGSKWDLKKIRDVNVSGNKKLKQTTLSTIFCTKPVDISTSNQFKGGVANETNLSCKTDSVDMELTIMNTTKIEKENKPIEPCISSQETIFYPDSPSKHTQKATVFEEADTGFPEDYFRVDQTNVDIPIGTAYQETFFDPKVSSTVKEDHTKPVHQPVVKNSFDYLPSPNNSPNYKYRRDPLRKKADRQKLPGQKCIHCWDFYGSCIGDCDSNDQLVRKVSRHRDKYPLRSHTPPGLWNPKFDDTDGSD